MIKTLAAICFTILTSCTTSNLNVAGNERGSSPLTDHEAAEYKRAVLKCYKTGGSRVVKIEGILKCYD